jgi:hypothetical protein
MKKKGKVPIKQKIIIQKFLYIIILTFFINISGGCPVFAVIMDSKNYRLEIESSEPGSFRGQPVFDDSVAGIFQKSHYTNKNNYSQYYKLKIALFGLIVILLAFLYIKIIKRKYTITRKKRITAFR